MPGGVTKFQNAWLVDDEKTNLDDNKDFFSTWCEPDSSSVFNAYCKLCKKSFLISNAGRSNLEEGRGKNKNRS